MTSVASRAWFGRAILIAWRVVVTIFGCATSDRLRSQLALLPTP
jgi:hypothetical protein